MPSQADQPTAWLRLKVAKREVVARDVLTLDLVDPEGAPLPPFAAGAHVDVCVTDGLVRQYSLSNDPAERHRYRLGILREANSRGGSLAVHGGFAEGDIVRVGAPRNLFPLQPASRTTLLFAGGIGITPLLSMAYALAAAGGDFQLHYCVRDAARAAFREELQAGPLAHRVSLHLDDGPPGQRLVVADVLAGADRESHIYVCGPAGFIGHVLGEARKVAWPDSQLHSESFDATANLDGESFELVAARSGRRFTIPPGRSAAEVLISAGVDLTVSCEQGICGTCLTRVVEGVPDHRDFVQSEEEKASNRQVALCCSRSLTPVLSVDL